MSELSPITFVSLSVELASPTKTMYPTLKSDSSLGLAPLANISLLAVKLSVSQKIVKGGRLHRKNEPTLFSCVIQVRKMLLKDFDTMVLSSDSPISSIPAYCTLRPVAQK